MISYLRFLHPRNSIESVILPPHKHARYNSVYEVGRTTGEYSKGLVKTDKSKSNPPHGLKLFAGSAYLVGSREFIEWVAHNETVKEIIDWTRDTYSPDEMIWASLARLPGAPGARNAQGRWDVNELQTVARIVKWHSFEDTAVYPVCHGYHKRGVCVFGIGDIPWVC